VPLREPLYTPLPEPVSPKIIRTSPTIATLDDNQWQNIAHEWNRAQKKLVIAGGMFNNNSTLNTLLGQLAQRSDTLVVAENLSNLYHENFIFDPEKFLAVIPEAEKQYLQPDLLVTFGNSVVSKRLKLFLRNFRPSAHWLIDAGHAYTDTYQSLTRILPLPAETFFQSLLSNTDDSVSNYSRHFLSLHKTIQHQAEKILASLPFCDLTAVHFILNHLKEGTNLHLANSMPVRYAQLFRTRAGIRYYSNRGTSGIDGCTSTCAGMAAVSDSGAVLITGDLAFLYDSNALWNNHLDSHLKIIVLNNGGGNIFQMIDTSPEIEPVLNYFTTPHSVNLKNLVEAFGLQYFRAESMEQLNDCFPSFLEANVPAVLEITTDPEVNTQVYKTFIKSLQL
jgi:2-succinyl-5-enolpyruvyl-6-hydroxy-3-cyclohexene-1-carboxylate synthase